MLISSELLLVLAPQTVYLQSKPLPKVQLDTPQSRLNYW